MIIDPDDVMKTKYKNEQNPDGSYRAEPRPSKEELDQFYSETYFNDGVTDTYQVEYSDAELQQKRLRAEASIELIRQNTSDTNKKASFIEIGCGEGFLLSAAVKAGWDSMGVDYQEHPVKKFNPEVIDNFKAVDPGAYLDSLIKSGGQFNVVVLQNVLEHVLNPDQLLIQVRQILANGGYMLVQVPNDYSPLQSLAMQEKKIDREYWFLPPQHLNYYNIETFRQFVGTCGFEIVDAFTDFPIEMYLWGGHENYTQNAQLGPLAHHARVSLDLFLSHAGMEPYLNFYRAAFQVGLGRNIIALLKQSD
jgi:2-polyprenyl-3-methyl-5-hydroxy-6-metoxy-1,4-benzoquinol methylase